MLAFQIASIKSLWLLMNNTLWLIAHSTVHILMLLTGFFQMIHVYIAIILLIRYIHHVKVQLNA